MSIAGESRDHVVADAAACEDRPPRKVCIATTLHRFRGSLDERLTAAESLMDDAARTADGASGRRALDLVILPEYTLGVDGGADARASAVSLDGEVAERLGALARRHATHVIVGMVLDEGGRVSNAAVLLDRRGAVAGIYRKVHPVAMLGEDHLEGGVTPGDDFPVFPCDFGKLGVLICYDLNYDDGWDALACRGAEIVAIPSASPQTVRPAAQALRHRYYVVTATPTNNASFINPVGHVVAQTTSPGTLVHEIDLSYAILHWSARLENGQALRRAFGDAVGYDYSARENTGVFWSNDPAKPIGAMLRELGLETMDHQLGRSAALREAAPRSR